MVAGLYAGAEDGKSIGGSGQRVRAGEEDSNRGCAQAGAGQ